MKKENRRLEKLSVEVANKMRHSIIAQIAECDSEDKYQVLYIDNGELQERTPFNEENVQGEIEYMLLGYDRVYRHINRGFLRKHEIKNIELLGNRKIIGSIYLVGNDNVGGDIGAVVVEN